MQVGKYSGTGIAISRVILLSAFVAAASAADQETNAPAPRDPKWAKPITVAGLPNLYKVSDTLYRGAQPEAYGFKALKKMGIKTVVSLRAFHSDANLPTDAGLAYEHISFKTWHPEREDIVKFLGIVTDKTKQPVFVHCQHGADRTGTMCAIYRIVVEGWTKEQAIKEMTEGGFGFHPLWQNLIEFIQELNADEIKKTIQLPVTTTGKDITPHDTGKR
jgi:protein tyrosine/serine phosphatase